jgi:hypothetical protein
MQRLECERFSGSRCRFEQGHPADIAGEITNTVPLPGHRHDQLFVHLKAQPRVVSAECGISK